MDTLRPIDQWFLKQEEPAKGCLQFLRQHILGLDEHLTEALKYGMPFFCYDGKMCCYLWVHKEHRQPYIGVVEGGLIHHHDLIIEKRARMKILLIDAEQDLPMEKIDDILQQMLAIYRNR